MKYKNLIGGAITDKISIYNCDCMELLRQTPDNYYSLSICDPPYGIGADEAQNNAAEQRIKANGKSKAGRGLHLIKLCEYLNLAELVV